MYLKLKPAFLYTAYKIEAEFLDDLKKTLKGNGTCFFIYNSKNEICLVTNRHVIDIDYKKSSSEYKNFKLSKISIQGKQINQQSGLPSENHNVQIKPENYSFPPDPNNDVGVFKNVTIINGSEAARDNVIDYIIPFNLIATKEKIENNIQVGDFVSFPGFPEWHDKKENRPILRSGTIASDPRYNYSDNKTVNGDCIAYEAFSFDGSSGSPVFALQRGFMGGAITWPEARELLLVGINAGHLKTGSFGYHSGISYLYKSYCLLDLLG